MLAYVTIGTNDKEKAVAFTPNYWANWAQNSFSTMSVWCFSVRYGNTDDRRRHAV